jgi:hypothetical protein
MERGSMIKNLIAAGFEPVKFPDIEGDIYKLKVNVNTLHASKKLLFEETTLEDTDIATIEVYPDESIYVSIWDCNTHKGPYAKNSEPGISIFRDLGLH